MPTPPAKAHADIVAAAQSRIAVTVDELRRALAEETEPSRVSDEVLRSFEGYAALVLEELMRVSDPLGAADVVWIRQQFLKLIVDFASAACALVQDPVVRHGVAQSVQCSVLLHERRARALFEQRPVQAS